MRCFSSFFKEIIRTINPCDQTITVYWYFASSLLSFLVFLTKSSGFYGFSFSSKVFFQGTSLLFHCSTTSLNSIPQALNISFTTEHRSDASMELGGPLRFSKSFSSLCFVFDCVCLQLLQTYSFTP